MEIYLNEDTWPITTVNRRSKSYLTPFLRSVRKLGGSGLFEGVLVLYTAYIKRCQPGVLSIVQDRGRKIIICHFWRTFFFFLGEKTFPIFNCTKVSFRCWSLCESSGFTQKKKRGKNPNHHLKYTCCKPTLWGKQRLPCLVLQCSQPL